ncbi:HutD family protein [Pseudophaeobacter sp.]|uniref:HutD/Ves family protein n=1 Tax=Pseudophaeobacter sp. TaxID=1971739 RepID=UPI0032998A25
MRFSVEQTPAQPWKNGLGTTRELASSVTVDADLIWRASLAQIDQDGPFSAFPGLARIHCIVSGAGLDLSNPENQLAADPLKPLNFDGGLELMAHLRVGPCTAFNLIYDPRYISAEMQICGAGQHRSAAAVQIVYVLQGSLRLDFPIGQEQLGPGEGWQGAGPQIVDVAPNSRVVLLALNPV